MEIGEDLSRGESCWVTLFSNYLSIPINLYGDWVDGFSSQHYVACSVDVGVMKELGLQKKKWKGPLLKCHGTGLGIVWYRDHCGKTQQTEILTVDVYPVEKKKNNKTEYYKTKRAAVACRGHATESQLSLRVNEEVPFQGSCKWWSITLIVIAGQFSYLSI